MREHQKAERELIKKGKKPFHIKKCKQNNISKGSVEKSSVSLTCRDCVVFRYLDRICEWVRLKVQFLRVLPLSSYATPILNTDSSIHTLFIYSPSLDEKEISN